MDLEALVTDELREETGLRARVRSTSRPARGARRTRRSRCACPTATLAQGSFTGDGPVDAVFHAINAATGIDARLREFRVDAVSEGQDALGEVNVVLELDGHSATGQGVSTDILEASGRAYLRALDARGRQGGARRRAAAEARSARAAPGAAATLDRLPTDERT